MREPRIDDLPQRALLNSLYLYASLANYSIIV
uniref:Uncharacterized protein n=1 Tax=Myoviridae sp. ctIty1 TaxID=2827673 RepID=A0A8S5THK8_9CAUD|nr:MAG TPA: hypothetical protein [Myoviridae sp. ctIty1]